MEHSLHIAAKHFVEAVAPASPTSIRKKVKAALRKAHMNGNLGDLNEEFSHIDLPQDFTDDEFNQMVEGDDSDSDDDDDLTSGDSLGKALALVKQVSTLFKIFCLGLSLTHPII